jgi:hypothetical protein
MEQYKQEYNNLLKRYNNGCKYLKEHSDEFDTFINDLMKIKKSLESIVIEHPEMTEKEILEGF